MTESAFEDANETRADWPAGPKTAVRPRDAATLIIIRRDDGEPR